MPSRDRPMGFRPASSLGNSGSRWPSEGVVGHLLDSPEQGVELTVRSRTGVSRRITTLL